MRLPGALARRAPQPDDAPGRDSSSSDVRLKVHARHAEISIATDNETCPIPEGAEFRVRLASRRFFLAVPHNISFYDTLRKKMMWGVDIRS